MDEQIPNMSWCRKRAAHAWCDETTAHITLCPELAEQFALILYETVVAFTAERDKLRAAIDEAQRVNGKPTVVNSVLDELQRAVIKFPQWPTDPLHAMGIVAEEVGELAKEVLQFVYEPHKSSREAIHKEALQAAAMLLRFLESLHVYEYRRAEWHTQPQLQESGDE